MNAVAFGPRWSRREVLQALVAMAGSAVATGCGSGMGYPVAAIVTGSTLPPLPIVNPQPVPAGPTTRISMKVGTADVGVLGPSFVGLSYEKSTLYEPLFDQSNSDLIGLFGVLGTSVLRLGGVSVDANVWTPGGQGRAKGQIAPADVDALAAFLRSTGWRVLYGVNLGGSGNGTQTPALAAAEIAHVVETLGESLLGVELGNECDNYGAAGSYYPYHWSLAKFEALWEQYRSAIVAVTPQAPMVGPAGGVVKAWTVPFAEYAGREKISLVTEHYYRGPGNVPAATAANLLSPDAALMENLDQLKAMSAMTGIPFRMEECNSYWFGGTKGVSNAYASSLWAIDFIFDNARGGATGVNFQGGDHGPYTPIEDNFGPVVGPRPIFYGLTMAKLAGEGTLLATTMDVGILNVTSYAVKNSIGGLTLVIGNKDHTQNLQMSVDLPWGAVSASLLVMTQGARDSLPSLAATSGVTIQGSALGKDGSFAPAEAYGLEISGSKLSCYVPALSAVLITLG